MSTPVLYVAITNHGFGHATRTAAVVAELKRRCPEIVVILTTTAPRWLLEAYLQDNFIHRPRAFDIGVLQKDSLTMDKAATLQKLKEIRAQADAIAASEANFLLQNRVGLVLADIPPLASAIAQRAGVPCWMTSNFGWDFIYRPWGGEFEDIADWIADCFSQCDRLFRIPFHESMQAFPSITDVGLTGGDPAYSLQDLRDTFGITAPVEKTVLLTFGGLGLNQVPYQNLERFPDWQFIAFGDRLPDLPNLIKISNQSGRSVRPVDVMPLCHRIVSKPGYGTFAEACKLQTPMATVVREGFAEAPVLLDGIARWNAHQILSEDEFFQGNWDFLRQPPNPPRESTPLPTDGNQAIAQAILDYFQC